MDIGCFEPIANTYHFCPREWIGIVADPNPELAEGFRKIRAKDSFVNVPKPGEVEVSAVAEQDVFNEHI